jgi:hypothetical protein
MGEFLENDGLLDMCSKNERGRRGHWGVVELGYLRKTATYQRKGRRDD